MGNTGSRLTSEEVRNQLYDVMRRDICVARKAARSLELGKQYLEVENAHLTRIDPTTEYWEAIESTDPSDGVFPVGLSLELGTTYCRRTVEEGETIALHDAPAQGWEDDPAFETHELHCYMGTPVEVTGTVYGTVCFVSEAARTDRFTEEEETFVDLVARMLGQALEREQYMAELAERTEMVDVLARILRHNLRNDMNVVRGHAEIIRTSQQVDTAEHIEKITNTVDDLLEVSEKARQLSALSSAPDDRQPLDLDSVVHRVTNEVGAAYPETSVSVDGANGARIRASGHLEVALRELLENAAIHAGESPSVTVSIEDGPESLLVRVSDDGPGLQKQEEAVLQRGSETPLQHGSGLGLWLVYWVVTRHEGRIETTTSDTGTTVTITIPHGPVNLLVAGE